MFATRTTVLAAIVGTSLVANAARADGPPGSCECAVTVPAPAPAAAPQLPRWGIGVHLASMAVADPVAMDDRSTPYGGGGLQLRYRLAPRWQVELAAAHVQEQDVDDATARHLDSGSLSVLFHPRPYARWDLYLIAGVGSTRDGDPDATEETREASAIGNLQLGAGVERRFRSFALFAELRALAQAAPEDEAATSRMTDGDDARGAGLFTLGANYYF